jgi:molybdate transport system ATP-binding protein
MDALELELSVPLRSFALELTLAAGAETVALVGPSGAGKTTLLRAVAGLVRPARGRIACGGEVWFDSSRPVDLRPEARSAGFVFQEYALFPHLSVERNVAFGGAHDGLLERLEIQHLAKARPGDLSGGERQRVALARALARGPKALLLDEPMAALDPHTRAGVRAELHRLLRELALPTLLVTHDFEDACSLADRVGVLVDGRLRQLGAPDELLAAPADAFVASFAGGNVLRGHVRGLTSDSALTEVTLEDGTLLYSTDPGTGDVALVVYPWAVSIAREAPPDSALNHVHGEIASLVTVGNRVRARVGSLTAEVTAASVDRLDLRVGERVVASFKATATRLL